jgi:hypothetical protein
MSKFRSWRVLVLCLMSVAVAGVASAGHFLVVNDGNSNASNCTAIETSLTTLSHTFTRLTSADAILLTPTEVRTTYNATFYIGNPSTSPAEQAWCIALLDAGGNLLVADNDFGYSYGTSSLYTTYFEATYHSDAGSDGVLTGAGIMAGINPDISGDPYPDDFTISGAHGSCIFTAPAPSTYCAGTAIERTPTAEQYRGIYLPWDYQYTPAALVDSITTQIVTYLSEAVVPVELQSFTIE